MEYNHAVKVGQIMRSDFFHFIRRVWDELEGTPEVAGFTNPRPPHTRAALVAWADDTFKEEGGWTHLLRCFVEGTPPIDDRILDEVTRIPMEWSGAAHNHITTDLELADHLNYQD